MGPKRCAPGAFRLPPAAAVVLALLAPAPALPAEIRKKAFTFRSLFAKTREGEQLHRKPLTRKRLNVMFAARREDEESPFMDARREQERKMDEIRAARKRETQQPLFFPMRPIHSGPR